MIRADVIGMREARTWIEHCGAGWAFSLDRLDELIEKEQRGERG